ncbi:hypothetical protein BGZ47_005895 [Haplosporangium gracile]|nr:hypothetical protein BGZ47_005895 [Haplosporangium gracile]
MGDNGTYRNDEVEASVEENVFSSEDERCESQSDDCTDDTRDDVDRSDQKRLGDSDSDVEDTDIESDISDSEEISYICLSEAPGSIFHGRQIDSG